MQLYRVCEDLTQWLIYVMVVFCPWAFGTTQEWAIWTMNVAGYALGLVLTIKLGIRWLKGYRPARWDSGPALRSSVSPRPRLFTATNLSWLLAGLTAVILLYCLISALNARSTYHRFLFRFEYHRYLAWLPHSFDSTRTWFVFWIYLGLAGSFWAIHDWLLGKTLGEEKAQHQKALLHNLDLAPLFPARLRRLLWVLCLNGGLLGIEGVAQRLEGSGRLLWLVQPRVNPGAETQFGPWAYRANAAQYFNLLWPVGLGFWWTLHRSAGFKRRTHHLLLVCGLIMAACPIISTSRGGALISAGMVLLAAGVFLTTHFLLTARKRELPSSRRRTYALVSLFLAAVLILGYFLGWKQLKPRLRDVSEGFVQREQMYDMARPMASDYPLFGTGPGTFEPLFQLYRHSLDDYWPAQLHNDWLETRITFGWLGSSLIALAFLAVWLRWFAPGGIHGGRRFVILLWLALGGCLVHARFDFPFQIYSIFFLFLTLGAVQFSLTRHP